MKSLRIGLLACAAAAIAGPAMASSGSLVEFKPDVMPVVVQVNSQGRVTDILPSQELAPWLRQMLVRQIDAWITAPATDHGKPMASRFILEVAMHAQPRKDGDYDAEFVYVKSLPLAYGGALHWDVIDGGLELALVSDGAGLNAQQHYLRHFDTVPSRMFQPTRSPRPASPASSPRQAAQVTRSPATAPSTAMPASFNFSSNATARTSGAPRVERP